VENNQFAQRNSLYKFTKEAMIHNGRTVTSNRKKEESRNLPQHYTKVSLHKFTKEERDVNRNLKKMLGSPTVDSEYCQDFTTTELKKKLLQR